MGDSKTYPALMVCVYVDDGKPQEMTDILSPEQGVGMTSHLRNDLHIQLYKINKNYLKKKMQVMFAKQTETCCLLSGKHIN